MTQYQDSSKLSKTDQSLIVDYLYGELNQSQTSAVEERIKIDLQFAEAVAQQKQLEQILPVGAAPVINKDRMQGVHWSTHRALRQQNQSRWSLLNIVSSIWQCKVTMKVQLASIFTAFAIGWLVSQPSFNASSTTLDEVAIETKSFLTTPSSEQRSAENAMLPVKLIKQGDFEITNLSLDEVDAQSGMVNVTYSLIAQTSLKGNIANPDIQNLLATTIKNDVSDGTRLALVDLLKDQTDTEHVRDALSYSLLNDPNPGVRMAAAESLVKLSDNSQVRESLRQVLKSDINPGIRIKVFQALAKYSSEIETQKILEQFSQKDNNQYIREQAKSLLKQQKSNSQNNSI